MRRGVVRRALFRSASRFRWKTEMPLAENLHRLRITDGQTIEDVAEGAQLSSALVASIENGRRSVPQKAVRALAAHFGVPVDILLR